VHFHRARVLLMSAILSGVTILASVATALADGQPGPFPR
jgi:hypothetical protein